MGWYRLVAEERGEYFALRCMLEIKIRLGGLWLYKVQRRGYSFKKDSFVLVYTSR